MGRFDQRRYPYLLLNLVGGGILTVFAVRARDPGLMLMEGSWVVISAAGILSAYLRNNRRNSLEAGPSFSVFRFRRPATAYRRASRLPIFKEVRDAVGVVLEQRQLLRRRA